ncbi:MAG TPA: hypothetical protein PKY60_06930 [Thermoflexales bacterium]|nr:hypothetical protein [Thermoflexales bacterium]
MPSITDLPALVARLRPEQRARFERIFDVELAPGQCVIPETMRQWAIDRFGSVDEVEHQHVARIFNIVTWDGALINPLRARRLPKLPREPFVLVEADDIFAHPLETTAADSFGRVRGRHGITTGNVARWDGLHAVLIFDQPDPLAFTRDHLRDYFETALVWANKAHQADPEARYFFWMWNGGLAGGASIKHAHAQMALGRGRHYAKIERLRRAALAYAGQHGANYFDDLYAAHADIGLAFEAGGLRAFEYLAALRGKDTWIIGEAINTQLADALHDTLRGLLDRAGMRAFDVGLYVPPLWPGALGDGAEDWRGFPVIARIVGRNHLAESSDIGAGDLFAMSVIPDDPFVVKEVIVNSDS